MMRSTFVYFLLLIMASYLLGSTMCLTSGTNSNEWSFESDIGTLRMSLNPRSLSMRPPQQSLRSPVLRSIGSKSNIPLADMLHMGMGSLPIHFFVNRKRSRGMKLSPPSVKHLDFHSLLSLGTQPDFDEKRPPSRERWPFSKRTEMKPKNSREFEHNAYNLSLRIRRSNRRRQEEIEKNKRNFQRLWNSGDSTSDGGSEDDDDEDDQNDDEEEKADSTRRGQLTSPEVKKRELYKISRTLSETLEKLWQRSPRRNRIALSSWFRTLHRKDISSSQFSFPSSSVLLLSSLLLMTQHRIGEETPFENEPLLRIQSWNKENEPEHPSPFPPKDFRPRKWELTGSKIYDITSSSSLLLLYQLDIHPRVKTESICLREKLHTWENQILDDLKASSFQKKSHVELDVLVKLDTDPDNGEKLHLRVVGSLCVTSQNDERNDLKDFRTLIESIMRQNSDLLAPLSVLSHSVLIIPFCLPRARSSIGNRVIESKSGTEGTKSGNRNGKPSRLRTRVENRFLSIHGQPIEAMLSSFLFPLSVSQTRVVPLFHPTKSSKSFHNFMIKDEENQSKLRHQGIKRAREGKVRIRRTPVFRSKSSAPSPSAHFPNQLNLHRPSSKTNVQPQGTETNPNRLPVEESTGASISTHIQPGGGGGNAEVEHNQNLKLTQGQQSKHNNNSNDRASMLGLWIFLIVLVNSFVIILGTVCVVGLVYLWKSKQRNSRETWSSRTSRLARQPNQINPLSSQPRSQRFFYNPKASIYSQGVPGAATYFPPQSETSFMNDREQNSSSSSLAEDNS